jgi:hypothetical protein
VIFLAAAPPYLNLRKPSRPYIHNMNLGTILDRIGMLCEAVYVVIHMHLFFFDMLESSVNWSWSDSYRRIVFVPSYGGVVAVTLCPYGLRWEDFMAAVSFNDSRDAIGLCTSLLAWVLTCK